MHASKNPLPRCAHAAESGGHAGIQASHILQMPVLVLNASYEPINICGARRALVLCSRGLHAPKKNTAPRFMRSAALIAMPSVIRLLEYRRIPHQTRALSRKNILLRDRNQCQYCGRGLPAGELTLDHVVPRSRGGNSTWENLVACCHSCNRRKATACYPRSTIWVLLREPRPFLASYQPPDHAHARPWRRPLAQIPLLLEAASRPAFLKVRGSGSRKNSCLEKARLHSLPMKPRFCNKGMALARPQRQTTK